MKVRKFKNFTKTDFVSGMYAKITDEKTGDSLYAIYLEIPFGFMSESDEEGNPKPQKVFIKFPKETLKSEWTDTETYWELLDAFDDNLWAKLSGAYIEEVGYIQHPLFITEENPFKDYNSREEKFDDILTPIWNRFVDLTLEG